MFLILDKFCNCSDSNSEGEELRTPLGNFRFNLQTVGDLASEMGVQESTQREIYSRGIDVLSNATEMLGSMHDNLIQTGLQIENNLRGRTNEMSNGYETYRQNLYGNGSQYAVPPRHLYMENYAKSSYIPLETEWLRKEGFSGEEPDIQQTSESDKKKTVTTTKQQITPDKTKLIMLWIGLVIACLGVILTIITILNIIGKSKKIKIEAETTQAYN